MNRDRIRLLIVEDHAALARNLFEFLGEERYVLDFAADGLSALHLMAVNHYDVFVLDVMLPGLSGLELCRKLRRDLQSTAPILLITAKDQMGDKEAGFNEGADDYLVKPFDLRELQLRVEALHRRHTARNQQSMVAGSIRFNPGTLLVTADDAGEHELSGTAARIFEALIRNHPDILSHDILCEEVWGDQEADIHTLRTHVYSLRKQLRENLGLSLIKTVHGRGYRLVPPVGD